MRSMLLFFWLITLLPQIISAQNMVTCRLSAEIIPPISVVENQRMGFGSFIPGVNEGSIQLSTESERIASGNVRLVESQYSAGKFTVFATPGSTITLTLPKISVHFSTNEGTQFFTLDEFTANTTESGVVVCQKSGKTDFNVGATLHTVSFSDIPSSSFKKTYEVVFMYN